MKYGWKRDVFDPRDHKYTLTAPVPLPASVDLRENRKFPSVLNQGELGSCHDANTEVLTRNGWAKFSDLRKSDELASVNPETAELIYEKPTRIIKRRFVGDLVSVSNQFTNFRVTPDHMMLVRKFDNVARVLKTDYEFVAAGDLGWYVGLMNRIVFNGTNNASDTYTIPGVDCKGHPEQSSDLVVPMSLWLKFLGIYMAEGTMLKPYVRKSVRAGHSAGTTYGNNKVQIAAGNREQEHEFIREVLADLGITALELSDRFTFSNKRIYSHMCELGLFGVKAPDKAVPSFVFEQSADNIKAFLRGHFEGDGCLRDHGGTITKAHYTSSRQLAEDLQTLIFLSGNESGISVRGPRDSKMSDGRVIVGKHNEYRVSVCETRNSSIDRKRQVYATDYDGFVYCAEVPTYHTLVTRRNKKILISGNCTSNSLANAHLFAQLQQDGGTDELPSRLWIYLQERIIEGTVNEDAGGMIRDGIKALAALGAPPEHEWPYVVANFTQDVTSQFSADALKHKVLSYVSIPQSLTSLKTALYVEKHPISFGFQVFESFESAAVAASGIVPMPKPHENDLGGHAVLMVGYDDSKQAFLVMNSWGEDWGLEGFFWLPYAYVTNNKLAEDFWQIKVVAE